MTSKAALIEAANVAKNEFYAVRKLSNIPVCNESAIERMSWISAFVARTERNNVSHEQLTKVYSVADDVGSATSDMRYAVGQIRLGTILMLECVLDAYRSIKNLRDDDADAFNDARQKCKNAQLCVRIYAKKIPMELEAAIIAEQQSIKSFERALAM